jgi:hypothetical protein
MNFKFEDDVIDEELIQWVEDIGRGKDFTDLWKELYIVNERDNAYSLDLSIPEQQ